jgi:putative thioredoxin
MIDANLTNFDTEVVHASSERPVLVAFWAPGVAPCATLDPILQKAERDMVGQFKLVRVNAQENPRLASAYGLRSLPYVVAFRNGRPAGAFTGIEPDNRIKAFVLGLMPQRSEEIAESARAHLRVGHPKEAGDLLRTALALDPAKSDVRADYVQLMARTGQVALARAAYEPMRARAAAPGRWRALGLLIDAAEGIAGLASEAEALARVEADSDDDIHRLRLAQWQMVAGRWEPAMQTLLAMIRRDRRWRDELARRLLVASFELCEDAALVGRYRRELAAGLN